MTGGSRSFGAACFLTLALFASARLALPLLPPAHWSTSGYDCARYYLQLALGKPHQCVAEHAFGEGARIADRLDYVAYRREKFSVDARGYRNPPLDQLRPKVILTGSSFSLGLSLSDEETLGAQLNRRLGPVVYNAAGTATFSLPATQALEAARETGLSGGWVLVEILNRSPFTWEAPEEGGSLKARLIREAAPLRSMQRMVSYPFALHRIGSMINMRLQNDVLLPNPDRSRYPEVELRNGRRMLMFKDDISFYLRPQGVDLTAASLISFRDDLRRRNLRLAVVLVPTSVSVYWPLIARRPAAGDPGLRYVTPLERRIAEAGIPVVNCLPALRAAAERELDRGRLIYWPDDAHWNPEGVAVAADVIAPWLSRLIDRGEDGK